MINPGLRFGRYEVGARLGKGGFGVVHLAKDVELGRELAIKFLKPEYLMRPQMVQRFLQEARAAAKIGHPGIVTVFECGVVEGTGLRVDGTAFIAMELLKGQNLADRLMDGRLSAGKAIAVARQLADALGAAHQAQIIHRDLKPDNVFLVPDSAIVGGERVKVLDFGVAKLAEPMESGVHTHSQMLLGTPRYMSPEQSRSAAKVDMRSDIYTLGCMLFELVVGRPPFDGDSGELIAKHQRDQPPDVRTLAQVPDAYAALVEQMLAKAPEARPQTMASVGAALASMDGSYAAPVRVAPLAPVETESTPTVASLPPRSNRRMLISGCVLGAAAIAFGVAFGLSGGGEKTPVRDAAVVAAVSVDAAVVVDAAVIGVDAPVVEIDAAVVEVEMPAQPSRRRPPVVAAKPDPKVEEPPPPPVPPSSACDPDALKARGEASLSNGDYAQAIGIYRAAYKCKPEVSTLLRAYLASCKSSRADEAKVFFRQLPPSQQQSQQIMQICLNMGIDVRAR